MSDFTVKRLQACDVSSVIYLGVSHAEFRCVPEADFWSPLELDKWLRSKRDVCAGAFTPTDEMIGYCLTHLHGEVNKVHVENIFVNPGYRRHGTGRALIEFIKREYLTHRPCDTTYRFVALAQIENQEATAFFVRVGFQLGVRTVWLQG